eukprot:1764687-Rhodomonas_salina.3
MGALCKQPQPDSDSEVRPSLPWAPHLPRSQCRRHRFKWPGPTELTVGTCCWLACRHWQSALERTAQGSVCSTPSGLGWPAEVQPPWGGCEWEL